MTSDLTFMAQRLLSMKNDACLVSNAGRMSPPTAAQTPSLTTSAYSSASDLPRSGIRLWVCFEDESQHMAIRIWGLLDYRQQGFDAGLPRACSEDGNFQRMAHPECGGWGLLGPPSSGLEKRSPPMAANIISPQVQQTM